MNGRRESRRRATRSHRGRLTRTAGRHDRVRDRTACSWPTVEFENQRRRSKAAPAGRERVAKRGGIGFFRTLSIPLLAGREFSESIVSAPPSRSSTRASSKASISGLSVGRRFGFDDGVADIEIVGIVSDSKYNAVKGEIPAQFFLPRSQNRVSTLSFYVRAGTGTPRPSQHDSARRIGHRPDLPVSDLMTIRTQVQENVFVDRLVATLSASSRGSQRCSPPSACTACSRITSRSEPASSACGSRSARRRRSSAAWSFSKSASWRSSAGARSCRRARARQVRRGAAVRVVRHD